MKRKTTGKAETFSLITVLALAFFCLCLVVLLISGSLQIIAYYQTQQESIAGKLQVNAQDATGKVGNFIQEKISVMQTISMITGIRLDSGENQQEILAGILGFQPAIRQLALLDSQGQIMSSVSRFSQTVFNQFARKVQSEMVKQIQQDAKYISPVYIDEGSSEPMIVIGITEKTASGELKNMLVCELTLKFMWDLMEKIKVGNTGYAYVVDREGILVSYKDNALVLKGENLSKLKIVKEFIADKTNAPAKRMGTYRGITGKNATGTYLPLGTPDWAVVTEIPWDEAFREVITTSILTFIINLVMAGLAGLGGVFLARRLSIPLVNLTKTATAIAFDEKLVEAEVSGTREVSSLAMAFNSMTTQLQNKAEGFRKMNEALTEVIDKAKEIIVNLNSTSKEIEAAAQEQTSGASEYASGITEVSATLEELTITAKQITKNVGELVYSSEEVIKLLQESEKQLLNTVVQLEDVGNISAKNASKVNDLGNRSNVINEMVEVIKEIANKTNILSINASIEASQSGEAGTRFSVVAAEIRELSKETIVSAKKAEKAAREIQDLLNAIIISSESESVKVIDSGKVVKAIYGNIENITGKINNNYNFTQKIDVSIKQQESGSRQAADTMRQMAEIARQSAETARQTSFTVRDIVKISTELDEVTKKVKL